ncbi:MAG: hypothetical protein QXR84_09590 [Candidatus Bathyarchaeia archaeon]
MYKKKSLTTQRKIMEHDAELKFTVKNRYDQPVIEAILRLRVLTPNNCIIEEALPDFETNKLVPIGWYYSKSAIGIKKVLIQM